MCLCLGLAMARENRSIDMDIKKVNIHARNLFRFIFLLWYW